jgi:hypothetical protein
MFYLPPDALRDLVPSRVAILFREVAIQDRECARELLDFHGRSEEPQDEFHLESAFTTLFSKLIYRHATREPLSSIGKEPRAVGLI